MTVHRIEPADERHAAAIAAIYDQAARTSPATFDLEGKPEEWWREEIASADAAKGHMTLVAIGHDDTVLGYAKSGTYMERAAYDTTCLTSVYVGEGGRGKGTGGALYDELLARLERTPAVKLAVAGIADPNEASTRLHLSKGFTYVGTFTGVGTKFGRTWDVSWYQRPLDLGHPA
jgi:phosphinothricin acetyltransferase